jgi:hypothetical protein
MNGNGLSETLSKEFPNLPVIDRPKRESFCNDSVAAQVIYDPCWLVGFVDAVRKRGCFFVNIPPEEKPQDTKLVTRYYLNFKLLNTQETNYYCKI